MERRLAAILAADVVGYSRPMGPDEAGTLVGIDAAIGREGGAAKPGIDDGDGRLP